MEERRNTELGRKSGKGKMAKSILLDQQINISTKHYELLRQEEHGLDAVWLFMEYCYTARRQKTNQIFATRSYSKKGLRWGTDRVRNAKSLLVKLGLIDLLRKRNAKGQFDWYIKINFLWGAKKVLQANVQDNNHRPSIRSVDHRPSRHTMDERSPNALNPYKENAFKEEAQEKNSSSFLKGKGFKENKSPAKLNPVTPALATFSEHEYLVEEHNKLNGNRTNEKVQEINIATARTLIKNGFRADEILGIEREIKKKLVIQGLTRQKNQYMSLSLVWACLKDNPDLSTLEFNYMMKFETGEDRGKIE